jgi:hypothetical protein
MEIQHFIPLGIAMLAFVGVALLLYREHRLRRSDKN